MPEFNASDYFARQRQAAAEQEKLQSTNDKFLQVQDASRRATEALGIRAGIAKEREVAAANSLVGKLGLDPNGVAGTVTNLAASFVSGATREAGNLAALPLDAAAQAYDASLTNEEIEAIGRHKLGTATPEDLALISRPRVAQTQEVDAMGNTQPTAQYEGLSPLQMFDQAKQARVAGQDVRKATDTSSIVHQGRRNELTDQLGDSFGSAWGQTKEGFNALATGDLAGSGDLVSGLAKLVFNAGEAAVSNPGAAAEYIAENAPQLLVGGLGVGGKAVMTATNVGYATDHYEKAILRHQAENGGAYPDAGTRQQMAMETAALVLAEQVGDIATLGAAKGAVKAGEEAISIGLAKSAANVAKAGATGTVSEAATEGYQTFLENHLDGKELSAQDIYTGAVIGGMSGGGMAGGGRAVGEILKATPEHAEQRAAKMTRQEAQEAAIVSGDVTALLDTKSPVYDPTLAVAALSGNSKLAETSEEAKAANFEQASKIVSDLVAERDKAQESYDAISPEAQKRYRARLARAEAEGGQDAIVAALKGLLEAAKDEPDEKLRVSKLNRRIELASEQLSIFNEQRAVAAAGEIDVEAEIQVANAPEQTPASTTAAQSVINLSMAIPERVSAKQALALADNETNVLTPEQRSYLRAFADARTVEKDMEEVKTEVYTGGRGNIGIVQYRQRITAALGAGNKTLADTNLDLLRKFEAGHVDKAAVFAQAWAKGKGTPVHKAKAGGWAIGVAPRGQTSKVMNSAELVQDIQGEARAASAAVKELEAAYAVKFPQVANGGTNVQDVSQSLDATQDATVGNQGAQAAGSVAEAAAATRAGGSTSDGVAGERSLVADPGVEAVVDSATPVTSGVSDAVVEGELNQSTSRAKEQDTNSTSDQADPSTEQQDEVQSSPESAEQTSEEPGVLVAVRDKAPEGSDFFSKRLGDFVAQEAKGRPLVMTKDFDVSTADTSSLNDKAKETLDLLARAVTGWSSMITSNLKPQKAGRERYDHEDPIRFLMKDGDLEQNVKTALSVAVFGWVADSAAGSKFNDDTAINSLLGRNEEHPVSVDEREVLASVGAYQSTVIESLGQRVLDVLGFKARKDAPQDIIAKLKVSLGAHALKLLEDEQMVERHTLANAAIQAMRKGEEFGDLTPTGKEDHTFFSLARNNELVKGLAEAQRGSGSVLGKLFGMESSQKFPTLEPDTKVQMTTDTGMGVPKQLRQVVRQNQTKNERHVNQGPMTVLSRLPREIALAIVGVKPVDEHTHGANKRSLEAKNDGLEREYDSLMKFISEDLATSEAGMDQGFFLRYDVWKQQRVGIETTVANPQTSKGARWLTYSKDWNTVISFNDDTLVTGFKLRVAEGLGIKTEKGASEKTVATMEATLEQPEYVAGLKALEASLTGEITEQQQQDLLEMITSGGEKVHTLAALVAWVKYQKALAAGDTEFTTNLMGEVDGVANGTMLNHVLYGVGDTATLERGGFYTLASEFRQFNLWRGTPGNTDIYETIAKKISAYITANMDGREKIANAIWAVIGDPVNAETNEATKDGRTLVKGALNPLNYGAGFKSVTRTMGNDFVEAIYIKFEKLSRKGASQAEVDALVGHLNDLLGTSKYPKLLQKGHPIAFYMDAKLFNKWQLKALTDAHKDVVGDAVQSVVEAEFGKFIEATRSLVQTTGLAYSLYAAVYQAERESFITEMGIERKKNGDPVHDLSIEQEAELKKRLLAITPMMHTAMSQRDGDVGNGILLAKREKQRAPNNSYEVEVGFGQPLANGAKQLTARAGVTLQSEPGVVAISASTHSTDSAISHDTQRGRTILNIHDALGGGIGKLGEMTTAFNQATFENLLAYSPLSAGYEALARVVQGLAGMQAEGKLSVQAIAGIKAAVAELQAKDESVTGIGDVLEKAFTNALIADSAKLNTMAQWAVVDQYPMDNNGYQVTDADRARAKKKEAGLPSTMAEPVVKAASALDRAVGTKTEKVAPKVESPKATAGELIAQIRAKLTGTDHISQFNLQLLSLLNKTVPHDLPVEFTSNNGATYGRYHNDSFAGKEWIEISVSGQQLVETGLHELTHAALAKIIEHENKQKHGTNRLKPVEGYTSEASDLIAELTKLMNKCQEYAHKNGILGFDSVGALTDIHEFISWGMTNQKFQREVLSKVTMQSKTRTTELVDGMQAFIQRIVGLLFKGSDKSRQAIAVNGMTVLINNVSGLFNQAAQAKPEAAGKIKLSMVATTTAAFSRWFGKSKVVDANGKPLVVYHGTVSDFEAFDPKLAGSNTRHATAKLGFFFSADATVADLFSGEREGANTVPVYLSIKNPKVLSAVHFRTLAQLSSFGMADKAIEQLRKSGLIERLLGMGHDGILIKGDPGLALDKPENAEWYGDTWIAFKPEQIKSAVGNDGSFDSNSPLILSMAAPGTNDYSTLDIHAALDGTGVTPTFEAHLRGLLGGIVNKLHGPFGSFKAMLMKDQAGTPLDVWAKALATGVAPFASSVMASPLQSSEQEAHAMEQIEATMRAALDAGEVSTKSVYKELYRLYEEMRVAIKPSDFASQDEYDFIFKMEGGADGRSHHLARFAAFGLAHQGFNRLLKRDTSTKGKQAKVMTWADRLQRLFEQVLEFFQEKISRTYSGQPADSKLTTLVDQLVDMEARKRVTLAMRAADGRDGVYGHVETAMDGVAGLLKAGALKALDSGVVKNSKSVIVRGAGALGRVYANDRVEAFIDTIYKIRGAHRKDTHGLAMQMLTEVKGPGQMWDALARASNAMQSTRKTIITRTAKMASQAFTGAKMSLETKAAIAQVFMRTGMHALTDKFTMAELEQLMSDPQVRHAAATELETQLSSFGRFKDHFIHQANGLAKFRVSGELRNKTQMMNAHNIARMYGTAYVGQLTEAQSRQVEGVVEQLVVLYAMDYVQAGSMRQAVEVLRAENARTDGNGVEFVLRLHKRLEQESIERNFANQKALMMHGYTPEIYNNSTDVKTANAEDGKDLVLQGYTKIHKVSRDPADPDQEQLYLYALRDGGKLGYRSGVISTTGKNAKGSKAHSGYMNPNTADGLANGSKHVDILHGKNEPLASGPRPDLNQRGTTYMAPVVNPQGEIVNWRYMMHDKTKDMRQVLERDNRFDTILGVLAGSIYDKETTTEVNTRAFQAAKDQFDAEHDTDPGAYIKISPQSPDPELREIWSMLPDDTKAIVRKMWGTDGLHVRKDQLTLMFGYRQASLSDMFRKNPAAREEVEKAIVGMTEFMLAVAYRTKNPSASQDDADMFAKRAAVWIVRGEKGWQEVVHMYKDNLVIKSIKVMLGNIRSNLSLLLLKGVSPMDLAKHHLVALRGARAYFKDAEELNRLQTLLDTDTTASRAQAVQIRADIVKVKDSLARNPVKELIDAGMMPSIVEDVDADDNIYTYKSQLTRKTERYTSKLNPTVLAVGKNVLMTHDTKLYQALSRMTQLSDFVARYTLYQHQTTRKKNPLSKAEALFDASESFVNYDIPLPRALQYMDVMGITMFTKYFQRIQRVLGRTIKEHPGRALMELVTAKYLGLGPTVLDSSWIAHAGNNPLAWGALEFPNSIDDIATIHAAMALVK